MKSRWKKVYTKIIYK